MKKLILSLVSISLILFAGFGFVSILDKNEESVATASENIEANNDIVIGYYQLGMIDDLVPKGGYMLEGDLRKTIHYMSHQKVHADHKFGRKILIEKDKVESLYKMLDNYEYKHEGLYREILSEWKEGNFENAVEHHNALWEIDGGNKGKATRLLTKDEEKYYIVRYEQDNATKYNSKIVDYNFD